MEHDKIFNRAALDKLRSPEKLDTMIRIVGPVGWMGLVSLAVLCFAIVLWSVYGSFTEKAEGKGLIMDSAGLANITHMTGGKVTEIYVRTGNRVHRGQLVAHIEQPTREDIYSDYEGCSPERAAHDRGYFPQHYRDQQPDAGRCLGGGGYSR